MGETHAQHAPMAPIGTRFGGKMVAGEVNTLVDFSKKNSPPMHRLRTSFSSWELAGDRIDLVTGGIQSLEVRA